MLSSITKTKHALAGLVKGTKFSLNENELCLTKLRLFRSVFPSRMVNSYNTQENVVALDVSEVKEFDEDEQIDTKTVRKKKRISELEEIFSEKKKFQESSNNSDYFSRLKLNDEFFRKCMLQLKTKRHRKLENKVLIDNVKIIKDAISAGFKPSALFYSRATDLENLNLDSSTTLYKVSYKKLQLWADVVTSQGVVGLFNKPSKHMQVKNKNSFTLPITVICDELRDPGNMGSAMRVAVGVGCKKLILTKGCVDIWDPKVLRAAAGAHFLFPYIHDLNWEEIENEISNDSKVILADIKDSSAPESSKNEVEKCVVKTDWGNSLPSHSYSTVTYGKQDVVIIIGNEAFGLSENAYLLAQKKEGLKVFIPMSNGINSLNTSVALGIILYDVRRKMEELANG